MEYRTLGHSSLSVPAIGLGCMSMSGTYGKGDDAQSIEVVHRALDLGVNFLDSSDMYGFGHNDELLGRAIHGRRDQVVVTTKFGQVRTPEGRATANGRPDYVVQPCDASLKRLGVDVIDLYYQHRVDPTVPIEDTVGAMKRLIEQGKVRYLGLCEAAPATIRPPIRSTRSARSRASSRCSIASRPRRRCPRCASSASPSSPTHRSVAAGS